MPSKKITSRPHRKARRIAKPTNLSIEGRLKSDALQFVHDLGYSLSEYVSAFLEVQLIAAGRRKPKKPLDPMPGLLHHKDDVSKGSTNTKSPAY